MEENGHAANVKLINFNDKASTPFSPKEEEKGGGRGGRGERGGRGGADHYPPRDRIEDLPLFVYTRETDKNVTKMSVKESILKDLLFYKKKGYPVIRFKFNPKFD
jgi:hypothetical protein